MSLSYEKLRNTLLKKEKGGSPSSSKNTRKGRGRRCVTAPEGQVLRDGACPFKGQALHDGARSLQTTWPRRRTRVGSRIHGQNFVQGGAGWLFIRCFSGFPQRPRPCGQAHGHGEAASRALENSQRVFGEDAGDNAVPPRHACRTRPFARTLDG